MRLGLKKQRRYALVGLNYKTAFSERVDGGGYPHTPIKILSSVQQGIDEITIVQDLLTGSCPLKGEVYISLSLDHFEVINLSINKIPDETVGKVLPFHLEKALDEPIDDFIYDWQITKHKRDSLAVSVILFPRAAYERICHDFKEYKLECKVLEPDVYSATVYLEQNKRLGEMDVRIVMLVYGSSISIAVYEKGKFAMIRPITLSQPDEPFDSVSHGEQRVDSENNDHEQPHKDVLSDSINYNQDLKKGEDLLADFLISTKEIDESNSEMSELVGEEADADQNENLWQEYLNHIRLELMRTRDYYNSMIKGDPITGVVVSCRADLFEAIKSLIRESLEIQVAGFNDPLVNHGENDPSHALAIGVLS